MDWTGIREPALMKIELPSDELAEELQKHLLEKKHMSAPRGLGVDALWKDSGEAAGNRT